MLISYEGSSTLILPYILEIKKNKYEERKKKSLYRHKGLQNIDDYREGVVRSERERERQRDRDRQRETERQRQKDR